MRRILFVSMALAALAFAQGEPLGQPVGDEVRLVDLFDNHADDAVSKVLTACDAIQARLDAGEKVNVRKELIADVLAIDEKAVTETLEKVSAELEAKGIHVQYTATDKDGAVLKTGSVGEKSLLEKAEASGVDTTIGEK